MIKKKKKPRMKDYRIIRISLEKLQVRVIQVLPAVRTLRWRCLKWQKRKVCKTVRIKKSRLDRCLMGFKIKI